MLVLPPPSYWEKVSFLDTQGVIIIGGGIVGLTAALHCKAQQPTLPVTVIDRGALPLGASTRNAGFACFGSLTELISDRQHTPEAAIFALVERRWRGLQRLRKRLGDAHLEYHQHGGYEIFTPAQTAVYERCQEQMPYFNSMLKDIVGKADTYVNADAAIASQGLAQVAHLLHNQYEGQLHTGKMMKALLALAAQQGIQLMGGLTVQHLEETAHGVTLLTQQGWQLSAKKVLVCTNGFARQLLPELEVVPARNQVLITEPIPDLALRGCFHYEEGYYYFRNIDNRILVGGGRHLAREAEQTDEFGTTPLIQDALSALLYTIIAPQHKPAIAHRWSGILGIGTVKKPIIKLVSPHVGVAVRMGGMGVAIGSLVGEEGADLVVQNC